MFPSNLLFSQLEHQLLDLVPLLLSPPSTGERSGGHRHGWDPLLGIRQPRQSVPVVLCQGW